MYPIVTFTLVCLMIPSKLMTLGHHGVPYTEVIPGAKPRSAENYLQQIYIHPTTSIPPISQPVCNECERRFILVHHQMEYAFAQLERLAKDNRDLQKLITNLGSQNERLGSRIHLVENDLRTSPIRNDSSYL